MGNAKQQIDQSIMSVQATVNTLQQAMSSAEKAENKTVIQSAITQLNSACQQLGNFKD